jgi:hypothetical protein
MAAKAGVPRTVIVDVEAGRLAKVTVGDLRAIAAQAGGWLELRLRTPTDDAVRLLYASHARLQAAAMSCLRRAQWECVPEASFSIFGERGVIDVLAWHQAHRAVLVVEVKTALVDVGDLLATMDRRIRLAAAVARERGWLAETVSAWIVVRDSRTNRRRLAGTVLREAYPTDGRSIGSWVDQPRGALRALSFMSDVAPGDARQGSDMPRRVHIPRASRITHEPSPDPRPGPRIGVAFRE